MENCGKGKKVGGSFSVPRPVRKGGLRKRRSIELASRIEPQSRGTRQATSEAQIKWCTQSQGGPRGLKDQEV